MNMHSVALDTGSVPATRSEALKAALIAALLGIGLVFLTGFAHTLVLHNGAHDTRHALSFPCH
jgi:cobalt transporter subunit CbtB